MTLPAVPKSSNGQQPSPHLPPLASLANAPGKPLPAVADGDHVGRHCATTDRQPIPQQSPFRGWLRRRAEERQARAEARRAAAASMKAAAEEASKAKYARHKADMERRTALKKWIQEHQVERISTCQDLHLFPDQIIRLPTLWSSDATESFPLSGVSAEVGTAGGISSRGTLTRSVAVGGWQKKADTRESWMIVDGPEFQWLVPLKPHETRMARKFAAQVTALGRRAKY